MREFIEDVAVLRPDGEPPETWVLLNRTTASSRSVKDYRDYLTDDGWNVFTTTIPNLQMYAQSMLSPISAKGSAYDEMVDRGMLPKLEAQK